MSYWQVAVDAPLFKTLIYQAPENLDFSSGQSVLVPLGSRTAQGVLLEKADQIPSDMEIKAILEKCEHPILPKQHLKWAQWLSRYYMYPIGQVMSSFFPALPKHSSRKSKKPSATPTYEKQIPHPLTEEQQRAVHALKSQNNFGVNLLFGVTGSGKTEVYLEILEEVLKQGKQGLVLVPEISLTPQLIRRFISRFGDAVAVIHSHLTDRERTDQWWSMVDEKKQILIGARSALFCPLEKLGIIILDEEHEPSFKQEEQLKYHTRDAAIMLAREFNISVILGSATPSLETWRNTCDGKYKLVELTQRVENRPLPHIEVIDMRDVKTQRSEQDSTTKVGSWLSPLLKEKIDDRLEKGQQTALFLNRRGAAQAVLCPQCGHSVQCPNCSVTLTLHGKNHLNCHYCDYNETRVIDCPECKQGELIPIGLGTERLEEDLVQIFPRARIARADRDQIQSRDDLEKFINSVEQREVDILVGTQMIAKGLDFTHLTLVGVVLADIGINIPDFRSSERSFQLLTQMSGRAGRHATAGEVVIQTYNPDHASVFFSQTHNYRGFAEQELKMRNELDYPPYGRLVTLRIQGADLHKVLQACQKIKERLQSLLKNSEPTQVEVLGPAEAPLAKIKNQHRYHILLKSASVPELHKLSQAIMNLQFPGIKISVDMDPLSMM